MTNKTESRGLAAAYAQLTAAVMAIVIHPDYDPTVVGPALNNYAKRMAEDPVFKVLRSFAANDNRNVGKEIEDILRGAWPLGFGDKAAPEKPKDGEGGYGEAIDFPGAESENKRDPNAAAYAIEFPYGEAGKELNELLTAIEKNEGRPLTSEEKLRAVRAFNKAVSEGEPQTVIFNGKDGYLFMSNNAENRDVANLLAGVLGLGLGRRG